LSAGWGKASPELPERHKAVSSHHWYHRPNQREKRMMDRGQIDRRPVKVREDVSRLGSSNHLRFTVTNLARAERFYQIVEVET
jgi:hypothetical protein